MCTRVGIYTVNVVYNNITWKIIGDINMRLRIGALYKIFARTYSYYDIIPFRVDIVFIFYDFFFAKLIEFVFLFSLNIQKYNFRYC